MLLANTDWTTISVGMTTAAAAIAGSVGAQWLAVRSAARSDARDEHRQVLSHRRDACIELLTQLDRVSSLASGALAARRSAQLTTDQAIPFARALADAELSVSFESWQRMEPYITMVQLRINSVAPNLTSALRGDVGSRLTAMGGDTEEGFAGARADLVAVIRDELR